MLVSRPIPAGTLRTHLLKSALCVYPHARTLKENTGEPALECVRVDCALESPRARIAQLSVVPQVQLGDLHRVLSGAPHRKMFASH